MKSKLRLIGNLLLSAVTLGWWGRVLGEQRQVVR